MARPRGAHYPHTVAVKLSSNDLVRLDTLRRSMTRSAYLRQLLSGQEEVSEHREE